METAASFIARIARATGGLTPSQIPDEPLGVVGCSFARSSHGWLRGVDPILVWETDEETRERHQVTAYMRYVLSERGPDLPAWDGASRGLTGIGDPVGLDPVEEQAAEHGRWMVLTDGDCSDVSARECEARNKAEVFYPGWIYTSNGRVLNNPVGSDRGYRTLQAVARFGPLVEVREEHVAGAMCRVPVLVERLAAGPDDEIRDSRRATGAWVAEHLMPRIRAALDLGADRGEVAAMIAPLARLIGTDPTVLVRASAL